MRGNKAIRLIHTALSILFILTTVLSLQGCSGKKWALPNSSGQTGAEAAQKSWYEECIRRQAITISRDMTTSNQADFPVLIRITDQDNQMFGRTQPDGDDIYFTEDDGTTRLDHEIEYFMNTGTKELVAWVKIPVLSSTADTVIYMYYGDSDIASQENPAGVWSNNYGIVYHMDPQGIDSTTYGRNRVADIGSPMPDNTFLGFGMGFDGDDAWDQTDIAYWELGWDIRSHEVVFKTGSDISSEQSILAEGGGANGVMLYIYNGNLYSRWWSISEGWPGDYQSTSISANTTYHVIMSFEYDAAPGGFYELFVNGVSVGATETPFTMSPHGGDGGIAYTGPASKNFDHVSEQGDYFTGSIYELRVRDAVSDIDYAAATYNNQSDPGTFLIIGAEEVVGCLGTWLFRQQITISSAMAPSDQMYFPALIKVTDQDNPLFVKARSSGADIFFTMPDGMTKLAHELEYYKNTTAKELDAWVRIPVLSSASDTIIYMYYGNPVSGNQESVDLVWDDDFAGIWHLSEPAGNHIDSAGNFTGIRNGNTITAGQIDGAQDFNGSTDYISMGNVLDFGLADPFSVCSWFNQADSLTFQSIVTKHNVSEGGGWRLRANTDSKVDFLLRNDEYILYFIRQSSTYLTNTWNFVCSTYDGSDNVNGLKLYINGAEDFGTVSDNGPGTSISNTAPLEIGGDEGGSLFNGQIDEVQISNVVRSADWILTEYNNQSNPAGFLTIGFEETL